MSGAQAAWVNKKYHGHWILSAEVLTTLDITPVAEVV